MFARFPRRPVVALVGIAVLLIAPPPVLTEGQLHPSVAPPPVGVVPAPDALGAAYRAWLARDPLGSCPIASHGRAPGCPAPPGTSAPTGPSLAALGNWTNLTLPNWTTEPDWVQGPVMAYDATDGYVVLFGGYNATLQVLTNDTWIYRDQVWTELALSVAPVPRFGAMIAYDAADGYVVLFGGGTFHGETTYPDTWEFRNGRWTELTADPINATNTPESRYLGAMSYDPVSEQVVLFGGCSGFECSVPLNDTWTFHAGVWTNRTGTSGAAPSPWRAISSMAWDPATQSLILYGGENLTGVLFSDTWSFASGTWSALATGGGAPATAGSWLAWDPIDGYLVLAAGSLGGSTYVLVNDNWTYLPTTGTAPTGAYETAAGVYDAADGYDVLLDQTGDLYLFTGSLLSYLSLSRPALDAHESANITAKPVGGTAPFTFAYFGLPTNCTPGNVSVFSCTFPTAGVLDVWTNVTDAHGLVSNRSTNLTVYPVLAATGSVVPDAVDEGSIVNYTLLPTGGSGSFQYAYGPLPPGCGQGDRDPLGCQPLQTGNFTTWGAVTDLSGATVQVEDLNLTVYPSLEVNLTPRDFSIDLGESFTLKAVASGGDGTLTPLWSGLPAECPAGSAWNVTCTPRSNGVEHVSLAVTDQLPFTVASTISTILVNVSPSVSLLVESPQGLAPFTTMLWDTITNGTPPYHLTWNFGDGTNALYPGPESVQHTFAASGTYTVRVNGTDADGRLFNDTIQVSAVNPLVVRIHTDPSDEVLDVGEPLTLTASTTGGGSPLGYAWIGLPHECSAGNQQVVTCRPDESGDDRVTVTVSDPLGELQDDTITVAIAPRLVASMSTSAASSGCTTPYVENLTAEAANGVAPYRYAWTFGDGETGGAGPTAYHPYGRGGRYPVALIVTDATNATAAASAAVSVGPSGCPAEFLGVPLTLGGWGLIAGLAAAAGVGAALLVLRGRRRGRSPTAASTFPAEESETEPGGGDSPSED